MKKAQMEILGLAIIVVLVSLLLLFVVIFVVNKGPSDVKKTFTHSELASNFLGALLKTSSGCKKSTISDLFQDCAKYGSYNALLCEDGRNSCEYVNETVRQILDATLFSWDMEYNFTAVSTDPIRQLTVLSHGSCDEKQSRIFPISLSPGTLIVKLDICQ